jgi:GNAT superfamily N-acetyltransferase
VIPAQPGPATPGSGAVVPADHADADTLAQVIAAAFHDLAPSRWLIADPGARRRILPGYFRLLVEHALASGLVHTTADRAAAALWLPAGPDAAGPPGGHDARLAAVTGPWASRFAAFDAALDHHHPSGLAHRHLAILAVRPGRQGQGTGTALLRAGHALADHDHMPAYLEAPSPRARDLYLAHGYVPRPEGPFHLPGGGPPMWPMLREPGAPGSTAQDVPAPAGQRRPAAPARQERM